MADDFVFNVRQIAQYALVTATLPSDRFLLQRGGVGGPYQSIAPNDLLTTALENGGWLKLAPGSGIAWNGASLIWSDGIFSFSEHVQAPSINAAEMFVDDKAVADQEWVQGLFDTQLENSVWSFNGRRGNVALESDDILRAGGILQWNPTFAGVVTVPTLWNPEQKDDSAASTAWVQNAICHWLLNSPLVQSFNGRTGPVTLTTADVNAAYATIDADVPQAPMPAPYDATNRIATTRWVMDRVAAATTTVIIELQGNVQQVLDYLQLNYAPLNSPTFTGHPTAPTPASTSSDGSIATTAFVMNAVTAGVAGVSTFNGRTGAIVLNLQDVTDAGAAPLDSPNLTGTPTAPTPPVGTNTNQLATCSFVLEQVGALTAGVSSFNGRSGDVSLILSDVTQVGGAPINSPTFTGTPAAPTAVIGTATTQLATTAFVQAALAAAPGGVSSFMSRTGAISLLSTDISAAGGALLAGPAFTGTPTAPTAATATNNTQLATTAFVRAAITAYGGGVSTFNGRAGTVTLTAADIVGVNGAIYRQSDTAPSATPNTFWFDSVGGQLYVNYVDPVTSTPSWVIANAPQPLAPQSGSRVLLTSVTITAPVASVDFFSGFDGTYDVLEMEFWGLGTATDGAALVNVSTDGVTFDTTANYGNMYSWGTGANTGGGGGGTSSGLGLTGMNGMPSTATYPCEGWAKFFLRGPRGITFTGQSVMINSSLSVVSHQGGFYIPTTPCRGLRFRNTNGANLTRGTFKLYGIAK